MSLVTVTTAQLIADLGERVIGPAEAKVASFGRRDSDAPVPLAYAALRCCRR
jgi:hypothetical protein